MTFLLNVWNHIKGNTTLTHHRSILLVSLTLALVAQYLLYGVYLGINAVIVVVLILIAAIVFSQRSQKRFSMELVVVMCAMLFFSGMLAVRSNGFLSFLNVVMIVYLLVYCVDIIAGTRVRATVSDYLWPVVILPFAFLNRSGAVLNGVFRAQEDSTRHKRVKQILVGVLMAFPVLVVFTLLFASGDMVFAQYTQAIFSFSIDVNVIARILIVFILTILFSGALGYIVGGVQPNVARLFPQSSNVRRLGSLELGSFLGLVNGLFTCFILIQVSYFFSGKEKLVELGLTYAEYARKGFFELVVVAVIAFALIWVSEKVVVKKGESYPLTFRILSSLLALQTLVVMVSSFQRLWLYEEAYGFTRPRFFVHVFLIWLTLTFILLIGKLLMNKRDDVFLKIVFTSIIVFLVGINIVSPDRFIVNQNIKRYLNGNQFDTSYLSVLSNDVVPSLVTLFESGKIQDETVRGELGRQLWERLEYRLSSPEVSDWRSAHFSRLRARNDLLERRDLLQMFKDYVPPEISSLAPSPEPSL